MHVAAAGRHADLRTGTITDFKGAQSPPRRSAERHGEPIRRFLSRLQLSLNVLFANAGPPSASAGCTCALEAMMQLKGEAPSAAEEVVLLLRVTLQGRAGARPVARNEGSSDGPSAVVAATGGQGAPPQSPAQF